MAAVCQRIAKEAPKLACCPSISSGISKIETKPINPKDVDDSFPFPILSDSHWYQRGLTSDKVNALDQESYEFVQMDSVEVPWWEKAETDDLGSFGSKKSHVLVKSCDLYSLVDAGLERGTVKCGQTPVSRGGSKRDTSKGKILEALCHSQTRAREAEIAVKKVCAEKEHAIKLLIRQASQLVSYRQWIYVLQIENLCYQMRNNKSDPVSVHAFSPSKIGKLEKNRKTVGPTKRKRMRTRHGFGRFEHDLRKYAVVFVVGLGIVGVGLVLGWTVGWMLI